MRTLWQGLTALLAGALLIAGASTVHAKPIINLAFALDRSASLGSGDAGAAVYQQAKDALAGALGQLLDPPAGKTEPDFEFRVSVVSFGGGGTAGSANDLDSIRTLVAPEILTSANLAGVQGSITGDPFTNTLGTPLGAAIDRIRTTFASIIPSIPLGNADYDDPENTLELGLINVTTDGIPFGYNATGSTDAAAEAAALAARTAALAAGWTGISVELVMASLHTGTPETQAHAIDFMQGYAAPQPAVHLTGAGSGLPNPAELGFLLELNNWADYEVAIGRKIQAIVEGGLEPIPVPAALPLMLTGFTLLGGVGWFRRRQAA